MRKLAPIILIASLLGGCTMPATSQPQPSETMIVATAPIGMADTIPSATAVPSAVPDPTPTWDESESEYAGCETVSETLPIYPQRLLYPDYRDLSQTITTSELPLVRHTTYRSSAAATILEWYREQARAAFWKEISATTTTIKYDYGAIGMCGPVFAITVAVTGDAEGSMVAFTREFSGPFSPLDWPSD